MNAQVIYAHNYLAATQTWVRSCGLICIYINQPVMYVQPSNPEPGVSRLSFTYMLMGQIIYAARLHLPWISEFTLAPYPPHA